MGASKMASVVRQRFGQQSRGEPPSSSRASRAALPNPTLVVRRTGVTDEITSAAGVEGKNPLRLDFNNR